jgi:hypothetical protein
VGTAAHAVAEPPGAVRAAASADDIRVKLPVRYVNDVAVDTVHQRVYISSGEGLAKLDFTGKVLGTGRTSYSDLTMGPDGSVLYAIRAERPALTLISTGDPSFTTEVNLGVCPVSAVPTGGKVWFAHNTCTSAGHPALGWFDPATLDVRTGLAVLPEAGELRADPDRPDRLALIGEYGTVASYDVSGTTPVKLAERDLADLTGCEDGALTSDAELLLTACSHAPGHQVFHTADLTPEAAVHNDPHATAVDIAPGDRYVAAGFLALPGDDVKVYDVGSGTPGSYVRGYEFPGTLVPNTVWFGGADRLFAVDRTPDENAYLNILHDPTTPATKVLLFPEPAFDYRQQVSIGGILKPAPAPGGTVSVTRTDRTGSHQVGTVGIGQEGLFGFTDNPATTGPVTYTVRYAGDANQPPGVGKGTTTIRPLLYDVNADGYAETVVGVPGETLGTAASAGMFHLLYGSATGPQATGSLGIHQDTSGVPGTAETGDGFGGANTSGDFNGDGFADVAVSASRESVGTTRAGGAVWIFYGSAGGLRTDNAQTVDINATPVTGKSLSGFGHSLAAGDFNFDGSDDLAVGIPDSGPGYVAVFHGDDLRRLTYRDTFSQNTTGVPGVNESGDLFGLSLATGDVDGYGADDLVIGAPYDSEDRDWATGSVTVLHGNLHGLTGDGAQRWSKDTSGVPGIGGSFNPDTGDHPDRFGWRVVLADLNGDGGDDLAVGAPGSPVVADGVRKRDAGTVNVLYSTESRIGTTGAALVSQQTSGMPGISGQEDLFGTALAAGTADSDRDAELAVYSPGDTYVTVVPGAANGPAYSSARAWTQNSSGIPGASESGDRWGESLRFGFLKSAVHTSLIVGAPGENSWQGACTVIHGSSGGLTGTGSRYFSQDTSGVPGTAESGDRFGIF